MVFALKIIPTFYFQVVTPTFDTLFEFIGLNQLGKLHINYVFSYAFIELEGIKV